MNPNSLIIKNCADSTQAPNYREEGSTKPADCHTAVVVGMGTVSGEPTVDLQFSDDHGNQYVAMLTGRLVEGLATAVGAMRNRKN